jgi:hypothetical protein
LTSGKYSGIALATLIVLAVVPGLWPAHAFSNNQSAVIAIGQWKSPSYGVLNPAGGLSFDLSGNLWVADTYNSRVLGFLAPFSSNMSASVVIGQLDFQSTGRGIGANRLNFPEDVKFDSKGNLWVADSGNSRLLEFEPPFHDGMSASVVIGRSDFSSASFNLSRNGLSGPWGITFDISGNLWVADSGNSRVLEFQPPFSSGMNASLVIGEPDFSHNYCNQADLPPSANGKCGTRTILNVPWQIAFDPAGNLWVAEGWNSGRVLEFQPPFKNGMEASVLIEPMYTYSLAFDSAGNLWMGFWGLGPSGGVFEFRPPFSEHMNASVALAGYPKPATWNDYYSQNIGAPYGLTFDSSGNLWVADWRGTWMMDWPGRVLGFDAHVHSVSTPTGLIYIENDAGLLAPLSSLTTTIFGLSYPQGLFNFTIQGLPPGGSVKLTITFPVPLPSGIGWWSIVRGNPLGNGELEFSQIPPSQTRVDGNNMTLTLTNASEQGVISIVGGPAVPPITSRTISSVVSSASSASSVSSTSPTSPPQPQIGPPSSLIVVPLAIVIVAIAFVLYRKRSTKTGQTS